MKRRSQGVALKGMALERRLRGGGANAILGTTKQARARAAKAFTPLEQI